MRPYGWVHSWLLQHRGLGRFGRKDTMTRILNNPYLFAVALTFVAVFMAAAWNAFADEPLPQVIVPAKVIRTIDGDTVVVDITVRANVRLLDCWSKELSEKGGDKAKAKLESLVAGKSGMLSIPLHDNLGKSTTMGRILGRLTIDGRDVSEQMVAGGHATKEKRK